MRRVLFVSLGCDKNLVDSEYMLGGLSESGYEITDDEEKANVIVINTCSFILDAQQESIDAILEMAKYKDAGSCKALIITGCIAQSYGDEILKELPQVDAVLGTNSYDELCAVIEKVYGGGRVAVTKELKGFPDISAKRLITTGGHFEYLKIAEGCDKLCTYCAIPRFRGRYRSVPMERLLDEAEYLAGEGVCELNIVAQETTMYGVDLYGKKTLHVLLKKLCEIEGLHWIRLMYCYPEEIYPELIDVIRDEPKICNYIDMPIQHCNDEILRRMNRRTNKKELIDIIRLLREKIPDIALRTTLISGFPSESNEQHAELLDFIREEKFDRLGAFAYSREDGTPAAEMENQISESVKKKRVEDIMLLQQSISAERNKSLKGKRLEVFVEGYIPDDGVYVGRTYADAHDIDGYIFFETKAKIESGEFVLLKVTGHSEYDLYGELV